MDSSIFANEISPSFAMKLTANGLTTDIWADNIDDTTPSFPSSPLSCSLGHPLTSISSTMISPLKGEYYNFNFRMGAPIGSGKDLYLETTPTITHG
eukprot:gene4648-5806_t